MEIYDWKYLEEQEPTAVALGFFDGVHLGHKALIDGMLKISKEKNLKSCVVTFKQHPLTRVFPKYAPKLITSNEEKIRILEQFDIDMLVFIDFTEEIMGMEPEEFIEKILHEKLNAKGIVVGFNYNFGKKGSGNPEILEHLKNKYDYCVSVVKPVTIKDGQIVSSTLIRNLIVNGKVDQIEKYLGRKFSVFGKVIRGKGLGRQFDIPTANIKIAENHILPDAGVYYTTIIVDGEKYHGLTNVGYNPTFENHPFSIETYIYNFGTDIYGETVELIFNKKIRKEKKFDTLDELIDQIKTDISNTYEKYVLKVKKQ
ncbi:bifunctional riboflavin kinase/FAD synthetase [Alkalibacter mobilis]|uniref:bifunctional riboflavin kinase/FAD synthetase n=1 Tax=Alkalibacter mobilis TaxID=2787712 RepID=UPI0018A0AB13|nr:bifunctional riboflavin kinase/FAD synthetase [Alkalibacter mobilis]MBF7095793.1 bifunctional riboflavin kinase/FAD synthetase [Alkalibacter mobilis]